MHDSSFSHSLLFSTEKSHPASLNTSSVKVPSLRPQLQGPQSDHISKDTDTSPSQRQFCLIACNNQSVCVDSCQLCRKPSRPCTLLFVMLRSECGDSFCTSSIKGNARTLRTERLSIFVSERVRGSGFNGDLASDFSNVQAVPRVRLQCKVAPGSGRERAGMVGERGAAHAAKEKTFERANQATKLVTNLPCSQ